MDSITHLYVRCNNPECTNVIETTFPKLLVSKNLFCSDYCRNYTHAKLKLNKLKKTCIECGRPFETYVSDREHCSIWCEHKLPKLTHGNYRHKLYGEPLKDSIETIQEKQLPLNISNQHILTYEEMIEFECYEKYGYAIDESWAKCVDENAPLIVPLESIEEFYQTNKKETDKENELIIDNFIMIKYNQNLRKLQKKKHVPPKRVNTPISKDDVRVIWVKCNNPTCDKYFAVNLFELNSARKLFCNAACKIATHRLKPRLKKYTRYCKNCGRKFHTYDATRLYCNASWCPHNQLLTPNAYKVYLTETLPLQYNRYQINTRDVYRLTFKEFRDETSYDNII